MSYYNFHCLFNLFLVVYFICLCPICMCIACINNTVYFFLLFVSVWDCWTVHETWNKSNIGGNPVLLDMMLLDSIKMWNMSYSHLMCYSNNIQLVIAIWHSMVEFDQIVKNSIHLNKWIWIEIKYWNYLRFDILHAIPASFFSNNHVHIGGVMVSVPTSNAVDHKFEP